MKKQISAGMLLFISAGLLFLTVCSRAETSLDRFFTRDAIRVLILTGRNNHNWRQSSPFLKERLLATGRFDVRVTEEPAGLTARTLAPYDLLVVDYCGPRWGETAERAVEEFVRGGKGLVAIHGANYAFSEMEVLADHHVRTGIFEKPWPQWASIVGGVWVEGPPKTAHGDRHSFVVKFTDREHPIAAGMAASFSATDELYHQPRMEPETHVIATAYSDPATRGTGRDEPILWTVGYGEGRTFYTALGHNLAAMSEPGFVATFLRGCQWAATGKVTLPAVFDIYGKKPDAPKVLVVTGGHEYDTGFYTLFDGKWLDWDHATSNTDAFAADIREKYDVLVLYDLSRELGPAGRSNLRAFVESGKGLVVLHHALADYNSWPWWWREVVGGRYILEQEGEQPASTYKHDVELFIRPVQRHPVTAGIGPMHFRDETYKGMWISPDVKVILETDEPTSDGPLAWISPYNKSRVAVIQLGHGRLAQLNPAYRELVSRAILWSAGKLE